MMARFDYERIENTFPDILQRPYITTVGLLSGERDWLSSTHFHRDATEILYVLEGRGLTLMEGGSYPIQPGDLIIYPRGCAHQEDFRESEERASSYFLRFQGLHIRGILPEQLLPPGIPPVIHTGSWGNLFSTLMKNLYEECSGQAHSFESVADNYLQAVILLVLRLISRQERSAVSCGQNPLVKQIKEYMDLNFREPITITEIARALHIDRYHLSHVFRGEMGMTPIQYLTNQRISEAKRLLAFSDIAIQEISVGTGYSSPSYFTTQFKGIVGMTPGEYRERNRGKADQVPIKGERYYGISFD